MSDVVAQQTVTKELQKSAGEGPKFFVVVEGVEHPWPKDTISFEEIVQLGGWSLADGVIEIDENNTERTLKPGEVVQLRPGHGFSKKVRWKRG